MIEVNVGVVEDYRRVEAESAARAKGLEVAAALIDLVQNEPALEAGGVHVRELIAEKLAIDTQDPLEAEHEMNARLAGAREAVARAHALEDGISKGAGKTADFAASHPLDSPGL